MAEQDSDMDPRQKFILGTSRSEDVLCGVISGLGTDSITTPLSTFSVTTTPGSDVCFLPGSHVHHGNHRDMTCINYRREQSIQGCNCLRNIVKKIFPDGFKTECREMIQLTWPISAMAVLHYTVFAVSLVFCGHLGKEKLGAVAMAITVVNVFGLSVIIGLSSACDTLFCQTFGSTNKKQLGITVQKALLILVLACIPCWSIFLNAEHLLVLIGEKSNIARLSGRYTVMFIAGLPGYVIVQVLSKYLQSQSIIIPSMIIGVIANVFNAAYHAVFLLVLNWDVRGAALAVVLTEWTLVILHVCYICFSGVYRNTWTGWSHKCFEEWGEFMRLAFPGLLMVCLEWWSFEILTFVTGLLGEVQLDAHAIVFSIEGLIFMIPLGISVSAAVRVGNHLGGGDTVMAVISSRVAIIMGLCAALFTSMLLMAFKEVIPLIFSDDRSVVTLATKLFPLLALMHLFDASQGVSSGVIRGTANQRFGALVNLVAYYILALPVAVPLMFKTAIGVAGAWWGMVISTVFQAVAFWIKIATMNWDKASQKAGVRAGLISISRTSSVSTSRDVCSSTAHARDVSFTGDTQELVEADHLTISETSSRRSEDSESQKCLLSPLQMLVLRRSIVIIALFLILIISIILDIWLSKTKYLQPNCIVINTSNLNASVIYNQLFSNTSLTLNQFDLNVINMTYWFEKENHWNKTFVYCDSSVDSSYKFSDWSSYNKSWIFNGFHPHVSTRPIG